MEEKLAYNIDKKLAIGAAKITVLSMLASGVATALVFALTTSIPEDFWKHLPYVLKISLFVTLCITPPISLAFLRQRRQLAIAYDKLLHVIRFDPLTELLSRRAFFSDVEQILNTQRGGTQCNVMAYLDLDHFKQINDRFGHATGDEVLRVLGQVVEAQICSTNIAGRLGGEEFGIFMPDCTLEKAIVAAQKLIDEFKLQARIVDGKKVNCTMSIGVTVSTRKGSLDQLLSEADRLLYAAKKKGRDCVAGEARFDVAA